MGLQMAGSVAQKDHHKSSKGAFEMTSYRIGHYAARPPVFNDGNVKSDGKHHIDYSVMIMMGACTRS